MRAHRCAQPCFPPPPPAADNLRAVFSLSGTPDVERLAHALSRIAQQSETLRWRVIHGEDEPRYLLHEASLAKLDIVDADDAAVSATITALCERPFHIDAGAPWSMTPLRGDASNFLVFVCHSALLDRFSLRPLFVALSHAYADRDVPPARTRSAALLEAEGASLEPEQWRRDLAFWVRELGDGVFAWQGSRRGSKATSASRASMCRSAQR